MSRGLPNSELDERAPQGEVWARVSVASSNEIHLERDCSKGRTLMEHWTSIVDKDLPPLWNTAEYDFGSSRRANTVPLGLRRVDRSCGHDQQQNQKQSSNSLQLPP